MMTSNHRHFYLSPLSSLFLHLFSHPLSLPLANPLSRSVVANPLPLSLPCHVSQIRMTKHDFKTPLCDKQLEHRSFLAVAKETEVCLLCSCSFSLCL